MDPFDNRIYQPMLIGRVEPPFDHPDYFFELKLDGDRCLAYLSPTETVLVSRRGKLLLPHFPELADIGQQVKRRCVLDGELVIVKPTGEPDFEALRRRATRHPQKGAKEAALNTPATFVAFDLLYQNSKEVIGLPLYQRREMLVDAVKEDPRLSISRVITGQGVSLFKLTRERGLEGIIGKDKASRYYPGKRTKEWVKIKNLLDDDFVVGGYIYKTAPVATLLLGQYDAQGKLLYKGRVTLGQARAEFKTIAGRRPVAKSPFAVAPPDSEGAVWLRPALVSTVKFISRNPQGGLRHPVFVSLRDDKSPQEAIDPGTGV